MGLYDGLKDVAKVLQQTDNIPLYKQLLDLSAQALDMQNKIAELEQENRTLRNKTDISSRIIRYEQPYFTLKDDDKNIHYCARCWDVNEKTVQGQTDEIGYFTCPECKTKFIYDRKKYNSRPKRSVSVPLYGV